MENDKVIRGKVETLKHIQAVRAYIVLMMEELDRRAREHDASKLESPEAEIFGEYGEELSKTKYGTPEYHTLLEKVKPATDHHYAKNRHHPQHHKNGVDDMDLIDITEMLCDWLAATSRVKDGNIRYSIDVNEKRFKMSPQLVNILRNTVHRYF